MTGPLYRLGRACSRHHRVVIALWVVAVIALAGLGRAAGDQTSDNLSLPGTDSTEATDELESKLPNQAYGTNPIVLKSSDGKLTDSKNTKAVDDAVTSLDKQDHVIKAVNPLTGGGGALVSKDETIAYIPVTLDIGPADLDKEQAQEIIDSAHPASDAGLEVEAGGYLGQAVSKPETHSSEVVGLTAAVIILLFAFGSAAAMMLPIISAVLGLISALAIIRLLGHLVEVPSVAPTLATMIGLGVGIDYALFIVTRHKLQLKDGMEMEESIARATATAGGAVAFAGTTVMIALCSLAFAGIPLVTTMGYTAAVAVVVAVIAAVTLLPAMLGALGPRIDSLRVHLGKTHPDDHEAHGWRRCAGAWQAPVAVDDRGDPGAGDPGRAGTQPGAGPERRGRAVGGHHGAQGLRPDLRRLRPGPERAAAGGHKAGHPGQERPEEPGRPEQAGAGTAAEGAAGGRGRASR